MVNVPDQQFHRGTSDGHSAPERLVVALPSKTIGDLQVSLGIDVVTSEPFKSGNRKVKRGDGVSIANHRCELS